MLPVTFIGLLALVATLSAAVKTDYPTPAATYEARDYTTWDKVRVGKSRKGKVDVRFPSEDGSGSEDYVTLTRIDLVGNAYDRGYAQGKLLHAEIDKFVNHDMNAFYRSEFTGLLDDLDSFPPQLQKILKVLIEAGAVAAPKIFKTAMAWVWQQEEQYIPDYLKKEIDGMAQGICDAPHVGSCNVTEWTETLQTVNMMPELVRMACTAFGAWGSATPNGGLIQLRALDFGGGPFVNNTIVAMNRETENGNAFVSVTFPGMIGVITGVSQSGVGVSEKVWMTYDTPDIQPGSYDGEPDVFVLRDILQNSKTREEAAAYVQSIKRTWAIWIGVGDYNQNFNLIGYKQDSAIVYDDVTTPSMTGQSYIENIAYVDKHPQPSHSTDLPEALSDFHGNITCETTKIITKFHQTGDVHIASYDFTSKLMYLAIGKTNANGEYGPEGGDLDSWKAYNRPFLKFNLEDLWAGN